MSKCDELGWVYRFVVGRFEGLSDLEWKMFEDIFPPEPEKRGKGMPHAPYCHVSRNVNIKPFIISH